MNQLFRAYILSLSLIRIPRLFISLLVWPLVIGLFIAIFQVVISAKYIQIVKSDSKQLTATFSDDREERLLRYLIYGAKEKLPDIKTCIWQDEIGRAHV